MESLDNDEIRLVLSQSRLAHLGLADGGRAYVLPVYYAFDGKAIYFHTHRGLKDRFIKATSEACAAVTRVQTEDAWESVLVFGRLEEVMLTDDILAASDALMAVPYPPAMGTSEFGEPVRDTRGLATWKLVPARMTGRKSVPPPRAETTEVADIA